MTEENTQEAIAPEAAPENKPLNLLDLVYWPNSYLKTKCVDVEVFDEELNEFTQQMLITMLVNQGYGISAPQVHDNRRIIIVMVNGQPTIMVNPKILNKTGEAKMWEGCLSVPGFKAIVKRAEHVIVSYQDVKGEAKTLDTSTLEMTRNVLTPPCIQHEVDHLDGKLFTEYLSDLKLNMAKKAVEKFNRLRKRIDTKKKSV